MPQIVSAGHTVGLHSMNHWYPWYEDPAYATPYEQLTEQIDLVSSYTGVQPNLWRAPGGIWEDTLPQPYNQTFYRYAWDINPQDLWEHVGDADYIYTQYLAEMATNAKDSVIVLLHGWTPEVLDKIIPDLRDRGYEFGVLPRPGDPIGPIIGSEGV